MMDSPLFTPFSIGPIRLRHRIVMAPLTRMRSEQPGDIPGNLMAEYYSQRASDGGLIVTEGTEITSKASGFERVPGIYSDAQVAGWHKIVEAIHSKRGYVFLQLWHPGRVSHIDLAEGAIPVGPSEVSAENILTYSVSGPMPATANRRLELDEIAMVVEEHRRGAERAKAAGFDGVEILAGGGYLIDQFLQDGANKRTDRYGGSIQNRTRFLIEVVEAVASAWDCGRIGVRLTPSGTFNSISDSDPETLFDYVVNSLNSYKLAYLHLVEPRVRGGTTLNEDAPPIAAARLRKIYRGPIIAAGGFNAENASKILIEGDADMVAFGRQFIANPDLPRRIHLGFPLNTYNRATFYGGDHRGYTDYPYYDAR
jgi:N-ethylmaleimide reductase